MLKSISVKDLALIRECQIDLGEGLNILTGETGAGKSIILGSVRLALGERAGKDVIRTGAEYARVELEFVSDKDDVRNALKEMDLPVESDGSIFISRRIQEGRSVAKCNGEVISAKDLKRLAALLIDIHGQNDTRELLDEKNYRDILDDFGGDDINALLDEMSASYAYYRELKNELKSADADDKNRDKELSLAEFEVGEIENAKLSIGEDEELEERYRLMKNAGRIAENLSKVSAMLDTDGGAGEILGTAVRELGQVAEYDTAVSEYAERLEDIENSVSDMLRDIRGYMDDMEFSETEYRQTENRLDTLNHLKNKYGDSIEAVLAYAEKRREYIEKAANFDAYMAKLSADTEAAHKKALDVAGRVHEARVVASKGLCAGLKEKLSALSFENVTLDIAVNDDVNSLDAHGYDDVDILVSFNLGEPVKSLNKVASGGELSRFMLALKEVTASKGGVETLVFDEIDAGISGKTAWNVSGSMKNLSSSHQVIAITHLPQIAARADEHYLIEKRTEGGGTVTDIRPLDTEQRVEEIARLLSGGELTEAGIENARELIKNGEKGGC